MLYEVITVYLTENIIMGTYWTIKHMYKDSEVVISAYSECEMLKKINYPTLPRIFDFIEEENDIYKIINVRYASTKDIIKTLEISMSDFDKSVRKDRITSYNVCYTKLLR